MYKAIEGTFNYEDVDFDYKVTYYEGDKGDYYTAPSQPEVDIDFIGFLPDTDLYECLDDKVIDALREYIIESE